MLTDFGLAKDRTKRFDASGCSSRQRGVHVTEQAVGGDRCRRRSGCLSARLRAYYANTGGAPLSAVQRDGV